MKLTQERLVELKTMAEHARSHFCIELAEAFVRSVPDLIADLEEAQRRISISEAFAKELSSELITTRKQLEELRAEYIVTLDNLSAAYESVRAQWNLGYAEGSQEVKHWRANHDNVVAKLRLFTQREDMPVDRLPAYEYVLELEKKLAAAQAREAHTRNTLNILLGCQPGDSSALDAAIVDAIADEARNPWKQAIGYRRYIRNVAGLARVTVLQQDSDWRPEEVAKQDNFIAWIDHEWQYDEVEI